MNTSSLNILVTGGEGQLASALKSHPKSTQYHFHFLSKSAFDITDKKQVKTILKTLKPDILINTAAYTAVDLAETEKELAFNINVNGTQYLAQYAKEYQIALLHLSTDYVLSGGPPAFLETATPHPLNIYGETKLLGENAIREYCPNHMILRVSGVISEFGKNFMKSILWHAQHKKTLSVVNDQMTSPTSAHDIADTIFHLLPLNFTRGTYHFCSQEVFSWYEFATLIMKEAHQQKKFLLEEIIPITTAEYGAKAKRSAYSVLNCEKIKNDFNINQPNLLNTLSKLITETLGILS